jgi:predicted SAM-dependent methyltransferase
MNNLLTKVANKLLRTNLPPARYALKLKRKYRLKIFNNKAEKILEICGGIAPVSRENFNVDILDDPMVDMVANLHEPLPLDADSIDKIISIATLMHFNLPEMRKVLKEFFRILKTGGTVEIAMPSLEKIFNYYKENGLDDVCLRHLHGAQKNEFDIHLLVMDYKRLKSELESIGFKNIAEQPYDYPTQDKRFTMKVIARK